MPRTGYSPFKMAKVGFKPKQTTVIVLTFIPHTRGYYGSRFQVLKVCLASLIKHTDRPFDLTVVDNGSRIDVVDYLVGLLREGLIQHLILNAQNLGGSTGFRVGN